MRPTPMLVGAVLFGATLLPLYFVLHAEDPIAAEARANRDFEREAFNRLNDRLSRLNLRFTVGGDRVYHKPGSERAYCGSAHFEFWSEGFIVTPASVVLRRDRPGDFDEYRERYCDYD